VRASKALMGDLAKFTRRGGGEEEEWGGKEEADLASDRLGRCCTCYWCG